MRINSATMVWVFTAVFIFAAGCISLGDNASPDATTQSPSASTGAGGQQTAPQGLTEAQKTQALNIAKGDTAVKEILGKPGYSVTGVFAAGAGMAIVYIEGGNTVHADGSIWTPDMYQVTVDISSNKAAGIRHIEPRLLPTPTPSPKN